MYSNIGGKIKTLAATIAILGMGLGVIWLIISISTYSQNAEYIKYADISYAYDYPLLYKSGAAAFAARSGIKWSIILIVSSFISSWPMYGFGQLIENSDKLVALYQGKATDNSSVEDDLPNI